MTDLDPILRRLKANVAHRLRQEARDLEAEATAKAEMASIIERTWQLPPQSRREPEIPPE